MKAQFAFIILLWGLVSTSWAQDRPFPESIPSKFFMRIGGGIDYRDSVELKNGVVSFQRKQAGHVLSEKSFHLSPDREAWTRFIQEINAAKLYRWSKVYPNPGIDDGFQWSIDLEIETRKFHSEGDNSYPINGDESKATTSFPKKSPPFDRVCLAVSHLIGREFQ